MIEKNRAEYLQKVKDVIQKGKYKDNWESLSFYPLPQWYEKAKFGIFIHWGVYSVPAFGNEWYARNMYLEGSKEYKHHIETYGPHKDFKYEDFIPLFKGEKFCAKTWVELFKKAGAKFVMPVAEHHDGFQMYDSDLSVWNSVQKGPKRDILGELKNEIEKEGMVFTASSHRAENFWFFGGSRSFDSGIQSMEFQEPYGFAMPLFTKGDADMDEGTHDIYSTPASKEHLEDWLARSCELVDKYEPKAVWFDWWIQNKSFKPYLKKFAAYYYNRSIEWGHEVAINYKDDAFAYNTAVFDIERGQLSSIRPQFWQNDTAIAKNSWGYTENNDFKNPVDIVSDLIDVVSKNGSLLLNVGPKADGSIGDEDREILERIGDWLKINGESIYDTKYWVRFGEGPTEVPEGSFTDVNREPFTSKDIRFTYKAPYIYANVLSWPENNTVQIKSLKKRSSCFSGHIEEIEILGFNNQLNYTQDKAGLSIKIEGNIQTQYPVCFKIKID
ncbi:MULTISPECIES: alpha-L-fucosidase [unclassified Oceanispirochaeta]|uniref:alpha-L-fucosidase n=1 Tax=unclassified Oceanispirochaeta TaxID=2635722 RepID=UPI000E08D692|nr:MULTISPECIES: alpha-L-fucosidase [unclassified Oceanispirochaeta]MBF9015528.1 alpha-L-fucosidase [Oceanispirochaeta sp. M2]NPD71987.1 alpha-L-fucosidase [Oceanispirochaeta sp. M1]RDG32793.1 alpha-L-fucosidase [Oceanispirochaeta sp. M1]